MRSAKSQKRTRNRRSIALVLQRHHFQSEHGSQTPSFFCLPENNMAAYAVVWTEWLRTPTGSQSEVSDKTQKTCTYIYMFYVWEHKFYQEHDVNYRAQSVMRSIWSDTKTFDKFAFKIFRSNGQLNDSLCTWAMISVRRGIAKTKFTMLVIAHDAASDLWSK